MKILIVLLIVLVLVGCKDKKQDEEKINPQVIITLSDERVINLELYPEIAPITVANFLKLVEDKYYDGVIFHRIIANFMIQTGGYYIEDNEIKEKTKTQAIYGEFTSNGHVGNDLKHELGVISMARTNIANSATSQFFICSTNTPHLDGQYAAFGKAIDQESLNVILDLSNAPTVAISQAFTDFPYPVITVKSIRLKK